MERYLIFDGDCGRCRRIARSVTDGSGGRLLPLSLRSPQAEQLLDRAFPAGWQWAPYVVTVENGSPRAYTGLGALVRLGLWSGPFTAWQVWRQFHARPIARRRTFLRQGMALLGLLLLRPERSGAVEPEGECYICGYPCVTWLGSYCFRSFCYYSDGKLDRLTYQRLRLGSGGGWCCAESCGLVTIQQWCRC